VNSHVGLDLPTIGKVVAKIVPPHSRIPSWKGLCADSEEKHVLAGDVATVKMDGLKVLDPNWPIREADMRRSGASDVNDPMAQVTSVA